MRLHYTAYHMLIITALYCIIPHMRFANKLFMNYNLNIVYISPHKIPYLKILVFVFFFLIKKILWHTLLYTSVFRVVLSMDGPTPQCLYQWAKLKNPTIISQLVSFPFVPTSLSWWWTCLCLLHDKFPMFLSILSSFHTCSFSPFLHAPWNFYRHFKFSREKFECY